MGDRGAGNSVAIRLEGGLGDHLLGMRVLRFIRRRFPQHNIIAYSDSGGSSAQLQVVQMSPLVSKVVHVYQDVRCVDLQTMGRLENLTESSLSLMSSSDVFIDAYGEAMFASASQLLSIPIFEILASRPELQISPEAEADAASLMVAYPGAVFVGMSLARYGADILRTYENVIEFFIQRLLSDSRVIILNLFNSRYEFPHWPQPMRTARENAVFEQASFLRDLSGRHSRVVPCVDLPLPTAAALLARCRFFLGVDNGIKHLAWAFGVPLTFFYPKRADLHHVLRWMPDFHRLLRFDSSETEIHSHIENAVQALNSSPLA